MLLRNRTPTEMLDDALQAHHHTTTAEMLWAAGAELGRRGMTNPELVQLLAAQREVWAAAKTMAVMETVAVGWRWSVGRAYLSPTP